ncbi:MutS protein msh4 [Gryganskiella cystojenkinii]|nr:MutS protein msh4 [Gryganskiella cystojenkinii]
MLQQQALRSPFLSDSGSFTAAWTTATNNQNNYSRRSTSSASSFSTQSGSVASTSRKPSLSGTANSNAIPVKRNNRINSNSGSLSTSSRSNTSTRRSRTYGPSTTTTTSKSNGGKDGQNLVVALSEGRGTGVEVGMCFCDLKTSEVILCQTGDSQTYVRTLQKLNMYDPSEILVPTTAVEPVDSKLVRIIKESLPTSTITPVSRRYFSDASGLDYIKQYIIKEGSASLLLGIPTKYFCLSATAAVMRHIEESRNAVFRNHSVKFKYQTCEGTMVIDPATANNLELVQNLSSHNDKETLFGILNETLTPMGARLLRSNILQPLTDEKTINTRLDCVQELSFSEEIFYTLKTALKPFQDVDHLITSFIQVPAKPNIRQSEQTINSIISLKHTLKTIVLVAQPLGACQNRLLTTIHRILTDPRLTKFSNIIDNVIEHNVVLEKTAVGLRNQRCFAVKAGCNGLLDVARQTYKETINDIFDVVNQYVEQFGLALKIQFSLTMGYYLSTTVDQLGGAELPLIFINMIKKGKTLSFTTLELIKKNAKISDSLTEVYLMSDKMVGDLSSEIRAEIGALYKASEAIAMLDMLLSFAHQCTVSDYVRPEFTDTLAIKQGRHPIIEKLYSTTFVPNDAYADAANSFQIITGPNMSGKSTYLRQVALLGVMAQVGTFVPAEYASIRIMDQLFSRICNDDNIELNASTFMVEMKEAAYIVQNTTGKSLVVMDELGRGTSTHDGLGIAFAVCEELIRSRSLVFFATHFQELTTSLTTYHNVVNLHLKTETTHDQGNRPGIIYKYRVTDGSAKVEHYGLALAKTLSLPGNIIQRAEGISTELERLQEKARQKSESDKVVARRRALANIAQHMILIQKAFKNMSWNEFCTIQQGVQQDAMSKLLTLRGQGVVDGEEGDA